MYTCTDTYIYYSHMPSLTHAFCPTGDAVAWLAPPRYHRLYLFMYAFIYVYIHLRLHLYVYYM